LLVFRVIGKPVGIEKLVKRSFDKIYDVLPEDDGMRIADRREKNAYFVFEDMRDELWSINETLHTDQVRASCVLEKVYYEAKKYFKK
jgi:hypothetical protein